MIDFLIKDPLPIKEVHDFILELFTGETDEVLFFTVDYFCNNASQINIDKNKIFFLFTYVRGEASMLLQLFNLKQTDIVERIINHSINKKIPCYIPIDDIFWIYVDDKGRKKKCVQIDGVKDNFFVFSEVRFVE